MLGNNGLGGRWMALLSVVLASGSAIKGGSEDGDLSDRPDPRNSRVVGFRRGFSMDYSWRHPYLGAVDRTK